MYNTWLMESNALNRMLSAAANPPPESVMAAMAGSRSGDNPVLEMAGDTARINITGTLTSAPDWMSMFFGGGNTIYGDIESAISAAESDSSVKKVEFYFDSYGGEAQPVADVGDAIAAMKKPNTAYVRNAASAAYWLASQAQSIVAINRSSQVGSIGTAVTMMRPSQSAYVDITSRDAPNKRPDPETPEGKAAIQDWLDQAQQLFVTAVAVGRDTTEDNVHNSFGKGGMMLAAQALEAGMIDSIAQQSPQSKSTKSKLNTGVKTMDIAALKAEHPGLYAEVFALGQKAGADAEHDRVSYHLTLGTQMGAEGIAIEACLNGSAKDNGELTAKYLSAGVNKRALDDRREDEAKANAGEPKANTEETQKAEAAAKIFSIFGGAK